MHNEVMTALMSSVFVDVNDKLGYDEAYIDRQIQARADATSKLIRLSKAQQAEFDLLINDRLFVTERSYALFNTYLQSRLDLGVTEFDVWKELCAIVYGKTRRPAWGTGEDYLLYVKALYWSLPSQRRTAVKAALTQKLHVRKHRNKGVVNASC